MQDPLPIFDRVYKNSFRSQHGGLWTDLSHAHELTAGKRELDFISDYEAQKLHYFIDNGYVILESIIPPEIVDDYLEELDKVYKGDLTGFSAEIWENNQLFYGVPYKPEYFTNKTLKIVDAHRESEFARKISLYPSLVRFLSLIFERSVLAFQTLTFHYGTQQPIHQDTAYVRVDNPMELVASWIALEDIQEGTGELEFYIGSHRLADYNFDGNPGLQGDEQWFPQGQSKWLDYRDYESNRTYMQWLVEESERQGLQRGKFKAKKGDVLIWTNDLAHGGSKIERDDISRLSLVTHYCPSNRNPYYFYTSRHSEKIKYNHLGYYSYTEHQR
jgi:ectoine hydroxylase-related dioxygenase (phytanoyl-CoA dioxygenase family)